MARTTTQLAGHFFKILIDKHFPKINPLHKIINRKNVKVSYGCCPNIDAIISTHNKKVTRPLDQMTSKKTCNCQNPAECPLDGNCCIKNIIYKAEIESPKAFYVG